MADPLIIKLEYPIDGLDGTSIEEMEVRRPTGAEMWQLQQMNILQPSYKDFVQIVSVCQHLPLSTVKKMDGADIVNIGGAIINFLSSSPQIGERSGAI